MQGNLGLAANGQLQGGSSPQEKDGPNPQLV